MPTVSFRDFSGPGAENYERFFVPAIGVPVSVALLAAAALRPGERVLDVACGTGVVARLAADQVGPSGAVTAVDVAPDMIDVARSAPTSSGAAIEWHVGDATALPFEDKAFDAVLCQMGLMFMADRAAAVSEMERVLGDGGRVVVSTPGKIQPPFVVLERAIVENISADLGGFVRAVFSMDDPEALAELLHGAGLRDAKATVSPVALRLPEPAEFLWQYINVTPMGPVVARAPEAARSAMERQAVHEWQPYVVDGTIKAEQPMIVATGEK